MRWCNITLYKLTFKFVVSSRISARETNIIVDRQNIIGTASGDNVLVILHGIRVRRVPIETKHAATLFRCA